MGVCVEQSPNQLRESSPSIPVDPNAKQTQITARHYPSNVQPHRADVWSPLKLALYLRKQDLGRRNLALGLARRPTFRTALGSRGEPSMAVCY